MRNKAASISVFQNIWRSCCPHVKIPEGMFILKSLPDRQILPESFVKDSRALLDQVVKKVTSHYLPKSNSTQAAIRSYAHETVDDWKSFADNIAPKSDNVDDYLVDHPLKLPLFDFLFLNPSTITARQVTPGSQIQVNNHTLPKYTFQDTVNWSNRGKVLPKTRLCIKDMIEKAKKVPFLDIIFHSDDEIDDDYSLSGEDTDDDLFNYRILTDREKKTKKIVIL